MGSGLSKGPVLHARHLQGRSYDVYPPMIFTTHMLPSGYWQLRVAEEDIENHVTGTKFAYSFVYLPSTDLGLAHLSKLNLGGYPNILRY